MWIRHWTDSYIQTMWLQSLLALSSLYPTIGFSAVDQPRPTDLEGGLLLQQQQHLNV